MTRTKLLSLVQRRRAALGYQDTVLVMSNTREADLAAHRADGRVGPNTIIVQIQRFDLMSDEELAAHRVSTAARLSATPAAT
jgi:hypothetical protein